ncbi:hypothetical protein LEP1GSC034_1769 [Leptospira interrogans str. 2003000735]|uniref:Uncharacterized protein n=3 Tax=Leptospira interrogans TaxID=173 RepID=A0AAQ1P099_LEPIR|nr:hypothetical protein G436_0585 [Leptospira interrogans serovar Hardjo str. Norma]EKO24663.1 hypothetical protein LEP1GSC104_3978 [Leptospira interrogans str. UI 12621]EKP20892.1 hypothetical protein LEP1GSC117_1435 [Leptospira interrogans serovar Icterohaemorrhagiae str. Verdun LP]EKP77414.1 hypothetical protein LEP1GSC173_4308 [Leptospira interrogans str. HAI1594]EKQ39785.1 hypothetical protein LEP1GSC025_0944 [Leptospira interrogans str. 2002000621]EKQ47788.1 hypothetical protein LEP1GSC0
MLIRTENGSGNAKFTKLYYVENSRYLNVQLLDRVLCYFSSE